MNQDALKKWEPQAWKIEQPLDRLPVPLHVAMGEAVDVARFCQRHWTPAQDEGGTVIRPGLASAVGNGTFTQNIVEEILELQAALQEAQTKYRLLVMAPESAPMERAQFVLSELRDTLDWLFDDGKDTDGDAQMAALADAHDGAISQDAVAAALFDYAELAERHRDKVQGLGGFDVRLIDEARKLSTDLREYSAGPPKTEAPTVQHQALDLRNRLATLLYDRMQRARSAARFVFRRHPELIRQVTSPYVRRQRAALRQQSEEEQEVPTTGTTPQATPSVTA